MANSIVNKLKSQFSTQTSTGSIMRNMAMLASGTVAAQVIGFFLTPVITRIYLPEHLGVLATFVALTSLLVPFGTLRYNVALPLPKSDGLATNLAVACFAILAIMSLVSALFLLIFAEPMLKMLSTEALLPYWWLLIITVLGSGIYEILSTWAVREKAFKPLARTKVWQSASGSLVKIGLGLLGLQPLGLLIGHIISQAGGILSLTLAFFAQFRKHLRQVTWQRVAFLLKYYSDFPKYRLPSQFLLVFSTKAPLLFSAWLFGAETTGQLGLALTVLALPISLFGQSTGQAYYAEVARVGKKQPEQIYQITRSITQKLFLVSLLPFLILLFFGPVLFEIVFGSQWREAGVFASILAVYLFAQFVSSPLVNTLSVFDRQWMFLRTNVVRLIGIIFVFGVAYFWQLDPELVFGIYAFALTIHYFFTSLTVINVVRDACIQGKLK